MGALELVNVTNYNNGIKNGYYFDTDNHTYNKEGYYKYDKKYGFWVITELPGGSPTTSKGNYKNDKRDGVWVIEESLDGGDIISKGK